MSDLILKFAIAGAAFAAVLYIIANRTIKLIKDQPKGTKLAMPRNPAEKPKGCTPAYVRAIDNKPVGELLTAPKDNDTIGKMWARAAVQFRANPCLGVRDGNGPFTWKSYGEVDTIVENIVKALVSRGITKGQKVGLYSPNRIEWIMSALACFRLGAIAVPLYDTLGAKAADYIIEHAEVVAVIVSAKSLPNVIGAKASAPGLRFIVCMDSITSTDADKCAALGCDLLDFATLQREGGAVSSAAVAGKVGAGATGDDLAYIMYTSGTTGNPKGVMLRHGGIMADALAVTAYDGFTIHSTDVHLSYLPLAHIFETMVQVALLSVGARIGFFRGDVKLLIEDIATLRPTIMIGVPRVYERICEKVQTIVREAKGVKKVLMDAAFKAQTAAVRQGARNPFWDAIIFKKIKMALGGRVRIIVTGAAPMSADMVEYLRVCFGCPVLQGYGMTETSAGATINLPDDITIGHVGPPIVCNEVKLEDVPDMNYLSTDTDHKGRPCVGRGEVCLRGVNCMIGYYKLAKETAETIDKDGWLHTGDVGMWNPNGNLSIIDRKKNIFKLSQGEYIAAEAIEMSLSKNPLVGQIWVYGNSFNAFLVAIVSPNWEQAYKVIKAKNLAVGNSKAEIAAHPEFKKLLAAEVVATAKAEMLKPYEIPKDIYIPTEYNDLGLAFHVDNDLMTPTFKLRRPQCLKFYESIIHDMYKRNGGVVVSH